MSVEDRLREGLEGLDALEGTPPRRVVDYVLLRGRRRRWVRRIAAAGLAAAAAVTGIAVAPKVLEQGSGDTRPAGPDSAVAFITTVAGTGMSGTAGDRGPAIEARINAPVDLGFDGEGNLYILELGYDMFGDPVRVRKVDASGRITTVAGPGAGGEAGRLVLGSAFGATGLAVDEEGNIYLGGGDGPDIDNKVIRVDPSGRVTTVAGTGEPGFSGDGGPATEATLQNMWDVAVDPEGNLYLAGNNRVRRVDTDGVITTIVGAGTKGFSGDGGPAVDAQTDRITGVTVDADHNVYFIDYGNDRIRRIDPDGVITTIAGPGTPSRNECFFGEGVPATQAVFCGPEHLAVDAIGNVYVADTYNHRIRMVDTNGIIKTIAGSGLDGYSGDGGPAVRAALSEPSGVAVGPDGAIYIADSANDRVRKVVL
jgi:sugar lactone lactonase YvrE